MRLFDRSMKVLLTTKSEEEIFSFHADGYKPHPRASFGISNL